MSKTVPEIVKIDLEKKKVLKEALHDSIVKSYIGGVGLSARLLYDMLDPTIDPLNPKNLLVFATGPLTGTIAPACSRFVVCSKSPLTGFWGEANSGGSFGFMLRKAGYYALAIEGKASNPVYISILNDEIEIRDARDLWGAFTYDVEDAIKSEIGERKSSVVSIGPAGEKLVKFASIINDKGNAAARTGMGTVMGSKNLKAVAVLGTKKVSVKDPEKLKELSQQAVALTKKGSESLRRIGTPDYVQASEEFGDLPIKYWTKGTFNVASISGDAVARYSLRKKPCLGCPIACHKLMVVDRDDAERQIVMPEYETLATLGSMCLNGNLESIIEANDLCNKYGIDTITTGSLIAFTMECCERGWVTRKELAGTPLEWGKAEGILQIIKQIGEREKFGNVLAEGIRPAAEKIGHNATDIAVHVKGLDLPAHDPRAFESLAVNYATSNRGACHLHGFPHVIEQGTTVPDIGIKEKVDRFEWRGKAEIVKKIQDWACVNNSLVMCVYMLTTGLTPTFQAKMLSSVLGLDISVARFMKIGERIFNLIRMFNVQCGVSGTDDSLPSRILKEPRNTGGATHHLPNFKQVLGKYYKLRGWNHNGVPSIQKLDELELKPHRPMSD
jgi:aldehyde:ferredoxin oxidoreductase